MVAGGLEPISADIGWGQFKPWTCHESITGLTYGDQQPHTHIHTYGQFEVTHHPSL